MLAASLVRSQTKSPPTLKLFGPDRPLLFSHDATETSQGVSGDQVSQSAVRHVALLHLISTDVRHRPQTFAQLRFSFINIYIYLKLFITAAVCGRVLIKWKVSELAADNLARPEDRDCKTEVKHSK